MQLPCASRTAAGAESGHLCLGTAFYTADKPSSSSQSASLPHSPFFPVSPHHYRCHHCRQPRGHAGKEGQRSGESNSVTTVQRRAQKRNTEAVDLFVAQGRHPSLITKDEMQLNHILQWLQDLVPTSQTIIWLQCFEKPQNLNWALEAGRNHSFSQRISVTQPTALALDHC